MTTRGPRGSRRRSPRLSSGSRRSGAEVVAGKRAVLEAVRSGLALEVLVSSDARRTAVMREVLAAAGEAGVSTRNVSAAELDRLASDHRGVVARLAPRPPSLAERDLRDVELPDDAVVVMLDGVTDPQNLGAAGRSAEAAGASLLVTRTVRAAEVTPAAVRASAGALLHLPHAHVPNLPRAIGILQDLGCWVVGLDGRADVSIYDEPCPPGRVALVVGSEGSGLSRLVRERCDALVALPMRGRVGSLNAAASLAAALFAWVVPSRA